MASQQSQKDIVEEFGSYRLEVSRLRNRLNEIDEEKASWFIKKGELSKKIRDFIQEIKDKRLKRDALTSEVKEHKVKRDAMNNEVAAKFKGLGELKKEKKELLNSLGIKEPPSEINQSIKKLEFKIETEPMPFDKEQVLMKRINGLKKLYEGSKVIMEIDEKIKKLSCDINEYKKEANDSHKLIQKKAQQSQTLHEEIIKLSAEIDKAKVEESAFQKFSEIKNNFNETNVKLKEKLKEMNVVKGKLDKITSERKYKKRMEQESFLKSKEEEVNNKIKRREKITTEDLLVFQQFAKE